MTMTGEEWFDTFRASMPAVEHQVFGTIVVDARTGAVVATNPRARELLGGEVPGRVQDLVESGAMARPSFDELVGRATGPHPSSWRVEVALHLPTGRADLVVFGGTAEQPGADARAVVAMIAEAGRERIFLDHDLPPDAPLELLYLYDENLQIRAIDPRLGVYFEDPSAALGSNIWTGLHPCDIHLMAPWVTRLALGELDRVEYTIRVITHLGNWTPAHIELRRLHGDTATPIVCTLDLVGDFKETIADGQLTPREVAIVAALFDGHRVAQIAERDGVSVKTLRNQLTAVYRKLSVADQRDLLATYHRPLVVPPPPATLTGWDWPTPD